MTAPPRRLRIGHLIYQVVFDQALVDEHGIRDRGEFAGWSHSPTQTIALGERSVHSGNYPLGSDYQRETLLHEVLHQCLRVTDCTPDRDAEAGVKDVEERTVSAIAGCLLAVLRDNPDFVTYLQIMELD